MLCISLLVCTVKVCLYAKNTHQAEMNTNLDKNAGTVFAGLYRELEAFQALAWCLNWIISNHIPASSNLLYERHSLLV